MKIKKIYTKAIHKDGIFIKTDTNEIYLLSGSLLAEQNNKLKDIKPSHIENDDNPLALSEEEISEAKVISPYNFDEHNFVKEDLKAVCKVIQ